MLRFAYRLAAHVGTVDPVADILMRLSTRQLVYWMAFLQLEPLPADRADRRSALHTAFLSDRLSLAEEPTDPNELLVDWVALSEPAAESAADPVAEADALILAIRSRFGHSTN